MSRPCRLLLALAVVVGLAAPAQAQVASIRFSQSPTTGTAGQAFKGTTGVAVSVANNSNTSVLSWQVDVLFAPPGSGVAIGTLASNNSSALPSASFTPDKTGCYRIQLSLWPLSGRTGQPPAGAIDKRNFCVAEPVNGHIVPPGTSTSPALPDPLSGLASAKPNELNFGGCLWGWAGCGADGLLNDFIADTDKRLPRSFANLAALAALPDSTFVLGMTAYVVTVGDWFAWRAGHSLTAVAGVVVNGPTGQWGRMGIGNREYLAAAFWSLSASGSDEAIGWGATESAADSHPLRSMQELDRRLAGWRESDTPASASATVLTIHFMDDITTADRFKVLHNVRAGANQFVRLDGTLVAVDGSASNRTITGYTAAVPASNTEREITISGLGTTAQYVGKIITTVDGAKAAVVMRQNSSDHLSISEVRDNATASFDGVTSSSISNFAVSDHVTFWDPVNIPAWPLPPAVPYVLANRLQFVSTAEVYATGNLGSTWAMLQQCSLGAGADGNPGEFEFHGGETLGVMSSVIFATHANVFWRSRLALFSVGVLMNGDGPFIDGEMAVSGEMAMTAYRSGGSGWRCEGEHPCDIAIGDDGTVAAFGMNNSVFALYSTHIGVAGNFWGSDSNTGTKSRFYGSGNTGFGVVLGQGSHGKFPKTGITFTTSAHLLNVAGIGIGDTFHNYDVADIPVMDLETGTWFGDSNPATTGGRF